MVQTLTVGKATDKPVEIQRLSYGLMNLTSGGKSRYVKDEQAFAAIEAALANGQKTFFSSADFYGTPLGKGDVDEGLGNIRLVARFLKAHPQYQDQVYINVKGCATPNWGPDASPANIHRSVKAVIDALDGKRLDSYGPARVDTKVGIEDTMKTLVELKNQGLFDHISLSEVNANTLRKAHAIHPIASVEFELSAWALDAIQNGLLDACRELGVAFIAYSPNGRGFLTGQLKSPADLPEGDHRRHFDRFQPGNFEKNLEIVNEIGKLADKKNVTKVQLVLAWLLTLDNVIAIPGSTRPEGVKEALGAYDVKLSAEELKELQHIINNANVVGGRYNDHAKHMLAQ